MEKVQNEFAEHLVRNIPQNVGVMNDVLFKMLSYSGTSVHW